MTDEARRAGIMWKLGGAGQSSWQKRYFVLDPATASLFYYDSDRADPAKQKGTIDVAGARIVDRGAFLGSDGRVTFSVDGVNEKKGAKEYFFALPGAEEKYRWVSALMRVSGGYPFLDRLDEDSVEKTAARLRDTKLAAAGVFERQCNRVCADCNAVQPTWAVLDPFGVLCCIDCIGVHRDRWPWKCKEAQLDEWADDDVAVMAGRGNDVANAELEFHVPQGTAKPSPYSSRAVRDAFIALKYDGRFTAKHHPEPRPADVDPAAPSTAGALQVPPKYCGVAAITLSRAGGASEGTVACVANGFQCVMSRPARRASSVAPSSGPEAQWDETLQLGLDTLRRPLCVTLHDGKKGLIATAEVALPFALGDVPQDVEAPLRFGPKAGSPQGATLYLKAAFSVLA